MQKEGEEKQQPLFVVKDTVTDQIEFTRPLPQHPSATVIKSTYSCTTKSLENLGTFVLCTFV